MGSGLTSFANDVRSLPFPSMNIKERFAGQKPWVRGGSIGSVICTLLFGFYLFIYFPILQEHQRTLESDSEINAALKNDNFDLALPMFTGHLFVMFAPMMLEGVPTSTLTNLCPETETRCMAWSLENDTGTGTPFTDTEGGAGYCIEQETTPESSCVARVEGWATFLMFAALEGLYFAIGAGVATVLSKKSKR